MRKEDVLKRITDVGVVAVVRADNEEQAFAISGACIKGGISAIEVTFTVPKAEKVIQALSNLFSEEELLVGAGTVLDKKTAEIAIDHGAKYIVSPGFDLETCEYCVEQDIPYIPGCITITEMLTAKKAGADIIKLFPGSLVGPGYVKAVKGPLPDIDIMPTGGVDLSNVGEWIQNGCVAVGVGSKLTAPAKYGDYEGVTDLAKEFVQLVKEAREKGE